jgi:hypothetical protein
LTEIQEDLVVQEEFSAVKRAVYSVAHGVDPLRPASFRIAAVPVPFVLGVPDRKMS